MEVGADGRPGELVLYLVVLGFRDEIVPARTRTLLGLVTIVTGNHETTEFVCNNLAQMEDGPIGADGPLVVFHVVWDCSQDQDHVPTQNLLSQETTVLVIPNKHERVTVMDALILNGRSGEAGQLVVFHAAVEYSQGQGRVQIQNLLPLKSTASVIYKRHELVTVKDVLLLCRPSL